MTRIEKNWVYLLNVLSKILLIIFFFPIRSIHCKWKNKNNFSVKYSMYENKIKTKCFDISLIIKLKLY